MSNLRNWTFREVEKFLRQNGFVYRKTRGSHFQYLKHTKERKFLVVVQNHGHTSIPISTMNRIVKQSHIPKEAWKRP